SCGTRTRYRSPERAIRSARVESLREALELGGQVAQPVAEAAPCVRGGSVHLLPCPLQGCRRLLAGVLRHRAGRVGGVLHRRTRLVDGGRGGPERLVDLPAGGVAQLGGIVREVTEPVQLAPSVLDPAGDLLAQLVQVRGAFGGAG